MLKVCFEKKYKTTKEKTRKKRLASFKNKHVLTDVAKKQNLLDGLQ